MEETHHALPMRRRGPATGRILAIPCDSLFYPLQFSSQAASTLPLLSMPRILPSLVLSSLSLRKPGLLFRPVTLSSMMVRRSKLVPPCVLIHPSADVSVTKRWSTSSTRPRETPPKSTAIPRGVQSGASFLHVRRCASSTDICQEHQHAPGDDDERA